MRNWSLVRKLLARAVQTVPEVDDLDLLHRYHHSHDAAAFELLVRRHADLVHGVCRRVCRDEHDAEDAFQATFLVLARKGYRITTNLAGWLHRTANHAAIRASHRRKTLPLTVEPTARLTPDTSELRRLLDAEIDRLPDKLRLAVLHCYVEGRSTESASILLGVPRGTILSRLSKAREILSTRLTRRGVTVSSMTLTAALGSVTASATLVAATAQTVMFPAAGSAVQILSLEVIRMTAWKTTTTWAAALIVTAGFGTGAGVMMAQGEKPITKAVAVAKPATRPSAAPEADPVVQRAEQIIKLEEAIHELAAAEQKAARRQIEHRVEIQRMLDSQPDPELYRDALRKLDVEMLLTEEKLAASAQYLPEAQKLYKASLDFKPSEAAIDQALERLDVVESVRASLRDLDKRMNIRMLTPGPASSEASKSLLDHRDKHLQLIKKLKDEHRAKVIEHQTNTSQQNAKRDLDSLESAIKEYHASHAGLEIRRKELLEKLRQSPRARAIEPPVDFQSEINRRILEELTR